MPDHKIVVFRENASHADKQQVKQALAAAGGEVTQEHDVMGGFSCAVPSGHLQVLSAHPCVETVEDDSNVKLDLPKKH